jgi:hypothetical protein
MRLITTLYVRDRYMRLITILYVRDRYMRLITTLYVRDRYMRLITTRAAAIQERVTAVLRSVPKEAFADSFQKLYEHCQQCVVKDGDYFEGQ